MSAAGVGVLSSEFGSSVHGATLTLQGMIVACYAVFDGSEDIRCSYRLCIIPATRFVVQGVLVRVSTSVSAFLDTCALLSCFSLVPSHLFYEHWFKAALSSRWQSDAFRQGTLRSTTVSDESGAEVAGIPFHTFVVHCRFQTAVFKVPYKKLIFCM